MGLARRHATRLLAPCAMAFVLACGDNGPDPSGACDLESRAVIEVRAAPVQSDGSVTLIGSVRFAPLDGDEGPAIERAVYAVYVALQEVQPAANDFNFRTWSITLDAERLAAFTETAEDGSRSASLPVRAHLQGGCVVALPEDEQPVIELP